MDRNVDVYNIDPTKMKGVDSRINDTLKPGAKDSIPAVANTLEQMSGSQPVTGKKGGLNIHT